MLIKVLVVLCILICIAVLAYIIAAAVGYYCVYKVWAEQFKGHKSQNYSGITVENSKEERR